MGLDRLPPDCYAFARRLIRRKARQLARKDTFSPTDREDVEQELWLHLCQRLPQFNPAKGTIYAFVVTILERRTATLLRRYEAPKRDSRRCSSLSKNLGAGPAGQVELAATLTAEAADRRLGRASRPAQQRLDAADDVAVVVAQLTPELRAVCEATQLGTRTAAAQALGLPRTTFSARLVKLRRIFSEAGLQEYL